MTRFLFVLTVVVFNSPLTRATPRPNIVVILADDLGYGDVKAFNPAGKIATPHLDRLAAAGMTFTDAHSPSAVCSPTRYGLLTGRYAWRTKLQKGVLGGLSPRLIEPGRATLASVLKSAGYHTACVGKWHLGMDWQLKPGKQVTELNIEPREQVFHVEYDKPIRNGPNAVGFDYYFGIAGSLDMVPFAYIENDRVTADPTDDRDFPHMVGRPAMTRKGPTAPGFAVENVLPDLTTKACEYIAGRGKAGGPFFLYLPLASPHTAIAPTADWLGKSGLNPYADFVMATDAAVGKVRQALADAGVSDNTLIVVTSDNGCSPQAKFPELLAKGHNPNHVFRGAKADIYEGGHRVPFLAAWPGKVKPGTTSPQLAVHTDLFRTCADAAGASPPDASGEDSFSFLPALLGTANDRPRLSAVHHSINGSFAVRKGDWKLCLCPGSGGWSSPKPADKVAGPAVQLFDLKADLGEKTNRQAEKPDVVADLTAEIEKMVAAGRTYPGGKAANAVPVELRK